MIWSSMLEKNTFKLRTLTWPVWYFLIRTSCFLLPIANLAVTSNWSHDLFVTFSAILPTMYMSETKNLNRISLKSFWFNQCLSLVIVLQKIDPNLNSTNQITAFEFSINFFKNDQSITKGSWHINSEVLYQR